MHAELAVVVSGAPPVLHRRVITELGAPQLQQVLVIDQAFTFTDQRSTS